MSAGNAHYYRCFLVLKWIARMARPVAATHPNFPNVQMTPCNVRSLIACVEIVLNFGARYQRRIEIYVSSVAGACMLLLGLMIILILNQITMDQSDDGIEGRTKLRESAAVWSVLYVIALFTGMVYLMVLAGAQANAALQDLVTNLTSARWELRKRGRAAADTEAAALACGGDQAVREIEDGRPRPLNAEEEKELDDVLAMAIEIVDRYHKTKSVRYESRGRLTTPLRRRHDCY